MSNASKDSQLQPPPANLLLDLRSDTVTMPTQGMRLAMQDALLGDDVFGEDESIQALQRRCAELTGHEAALFCPSGTMTNQIAIQVHTRPGDEVVCDKLSHIYNYEGGGIARNSGASVRLLHGHRGRYSVDDMLANVNPADSHYARTSLVAVEDTCNKGGGSVWDVEELKQLSDACKAQGLKFHLDGARVWNAWVKRGEWGDAKALGAYGRMFDSMSLCLSKGLGCSATAPSVCPSSKLPTPALTGRPRLPPPPTIFFPSQDDSGDERWMSRRIRATRRRRSIWRACIVRPVLCVCCSRRALTYGRVASMRAQLPCMSPRRGYTQRRHYTRFSTIRMRLATIAM